MGMFDWVDFKTVCPNCGHMLKGFQTKNGDTMKTVLPHEAMWFYTGCDKCGAWVDCEYIPPKGVGLIEVTATVIPKGETHPQFVATNKIEWDPNAHKKNNDKKLPIP